jgi:Tfp pilus assembly protein PilO
MTSMLTRIVAERRLAVSALAVALLLNLVAYVAAVRPLEQKSAGAADRAVAARAARVAAENELAQARRLVSGKSEAEQELNAFYQKDLPGDLVAARRMTYASLPALARKAGVQYDARTTTLHEPTEKQTLGQMQIRMVLRGDYSNLREFVYELERSPDFVIIDDIALTESNPAEPLTLAINLSTYFRVAHGS